MPDIPEEDRLEALHALGLLDTAAEAEYDAIVDLVTAVTGAKMAAVSLVDRERQWFKSAVNLPATETPRSWAFCDHAIRQDGIYEVVNALDDPLFAENPLVTGAPHIRGYAGVPIRLASGEKLGTLCAIHDAPLELDQPARDRLVSLARMVENLIRDRIVSREQTRLALVARHTHNSVVISNRTGAIEWANPAFERQTGYALSEMLGRFPGSFLLCANSDRQVVQEMVDAVEAGRECQVELVNRHKNGTEYTVLIELTPITDATGTCTGYMSVQTDITERNRIRDQLSKALLETQSLMNVIREHTVFSVADPNGVIIDVNEAFCQLSGYSAEDVIGRTHQFLQDEGMHPEAFWKDMWATIRAGRPWRGEICNRSRSGEIFWADSIIAPQLNSAGEVERYIFVRFDITERKQTEAGLVESQKRLESLLERLSAVTELGGIGSWEVDLDTMTPIWDAVTRRIHEVDRDYLPDMEHAINFYAPEARDQISQAVEHCVETGEPWDLELPLITAKNRRIWVRAVGRRILADGEAVRLVGSFQDISERREREEELRLISTRLEVALNSSGIGVWDVCPTTNEYHWDEGSRSLFNIPDGAANPSPADWVAGIHPDDRDAVAAGLAEAYKTKTQLKREYRYARPDGSFRHIRSLGVYRERLDAPPILTGVHMDMTADIEQAAALDMARERAESASLAKSEFLANMSHEIRTPLNGVLGMTQILQMTELTSKQASHVETIRNSGQALADLIDDILDISKIESGMIELEKRSFEMRGLVAMVGDIMQLRAKEKQLELDVALSSDVARFVVGDEKRIRQVLINIIGNAIKFTDSGAVSVEIRVGEGDSIDFRVTDTGPGIETENLAAIFDRFAQADNSITRKYGGTGLGLAICHELVSLMGGEIGVDSVVGEGSTFWFTLPLPADHTWVANTAPARSSAVANAGEVGRRVLVVDDVQANLMVIAALLQHNRYDVMTAVNGQEALDMLDANTFDAVLMDIQMPVMAGDEAIRRIRASDASYAGIPIFALTADATRATRELCARIGATGYFTKPLNLPDVLEALRRELAAASPSRSGSEQTRQA
ncbi:PAS domain S-box protein [Maricaulis maris]|uniref:PAS domain S-box protein n=1 Tax=Maricaulis maris TaxID=74318 RepID=UPI003BACEAC0